MKVCVIVPTWNIVGTSAQEIEGTTIELFITRFMCISKSIFEYSKKVKRLISTGLNCASFSAHGDSFLLCAGYIKLYE